MSAELQPTYQDNLLRFPLERVRPTVLPPEAPVTKASNPSLSDHLAKQLEQQTGKSEQRKPYTFDLSEEEKRVRIHGESYWRFFDKQVQTYLRESYAQVKTTTYHHDIQQDRDGNLRLVFGPGKEDAVKSYAVPAQNEQLPLWYRKRALADVRWGESMNARLATLKAGEVLVDMSPAALDVSEKERKEWGMYKHSFLRFHWKEEKDGEQILISQTPRHYLDIPEQVRLFKQITGEDIEGENLLGTVAMLKGELGLGHVLELVRELYENTPEERKLVPEDRDLDEEEVEKHLAQIQTWTRAVFDFIQQRRPRKEILAQFQGIEKAFQKLVKGEKIAIDLKKLKTRDFASQAQSSSSGVGGIMAGAYSAGKSDCPGAGSGYGAEANGSGQMSYNNMSGEMKKALLEPIKVKEGKYNELKNMRLWELKKKYPKNDRYDERYFPCPHCGIYNVRPEGELIRTCYDCNESVVCEVAA